MRPQAELREEKVGTRSVQGTFVSCFRCSDGDKGGHDGRRTRSQAESGRGCRVIPPIITGTNMYERKWTQTVFFSIRRLFRVLLTSFGKTRNNKVFLDRVF